MVQSITLQTSDSNVQDADDLGRLSFAASNESNTSDARLIGASIHAVAEGDFTEIANPTSLVFATAYSESATDKLKITSSGHFLPVNDRTYNIGSSSLKFKNIYGASGYLDQLILTSGSFPSVTPSSIYNLSGVLYYQNNPIAILPIGGVSGQILQKIEDNSYSLQWIDNYATELDAYVKNTTGSGLTKGQAVYINSAQGDHPTITLAIASGESTSSKTLGLLKQDLANNAFGFVVTDGTLNNVDTSLAGTAGDPVWLSPTTPGALLYGTANKPSAPNHQVFLGYVIVKQQNSGKIFVKVQNGFELGELHNVAVNGTSDGKFLQYNSASGLWLASSSGNFTTLQVNGTGVSVSGHTHISSNITDFNSSVSGLLPTIANSGDNRILTSTGSTVGINAESNLTFDGNLLNVTGSGNFTNGLAINNQTASTIASFDSNKNIASLSTTTYPSFTELSYVKGVTSAIQTQIDSKAATSTTITAGSGLAGGGSLAANRTIDVGQGDGITVSADSIAVDSTVVRTTGTQSIAGAKTFSDAAVFSTGVTVNGNLTMSNQTASTIAGYDASKNISSLSTATYPTLTELSYVKGVTSAIQTQLDNKINADAGLSSIAGLTTGADNYIYTTALDTYTTGIITSFGRSLVDDTDSTTARSTLGLVIGTNVQAYDAGLQSIAGLTTAADRYIYTTALDTYATGTITSFGRSLIDDADSTTARSTLGLVIGTNVQAYDAGLQSIAGLTTAADRYLYTTALDTYATGTITSFGRSLIDDADSTTARSTLGLVIGTNVQAYDAGLQSIAGLTTAADSFLYTTALDTYATGTITSFGRSLVDDTTASAARTTLGVSKTIAFFTASDNQPPSSSFATLDTRNNIMVIDFDDGATNEVSVFLGIIPEGADLTSGLSVRINWMATSATTGNCRWGVQFEKMTTDMDADSFDTATEAHSATNATAGIPTITTLTCTSIDSLTAGDFFRIKIYRDSSDTTNDTMVGDAELISVEVRSVL